MRDDEWRSEEILLKRRLAKIKLERQLERRAAKPTNLKVEIAMAVWGTLLLLGGVAAVFAQHYSSPPPLQPISAPPTPTTNPTCVVGPQPRDCMSPNGPCQTLEHCDIFQSPPITTMPTTPALGGCSEGETPQGRCLTDPSAFITALKNNGFNITDDRATLDSGVRVCDVMFDGQESMDQLAQDMYDQSPGVFSSLDRARVALRLTEQYLCPIRDGHMPTPGRPVSPLPSPSPTPAVPPGNPHISYI